MRKHGLNRWNWSEKIGKWVYVAEDKEGKRKYSYQLEPPKEFIDLTMEIKKLNDKLMVAKDQDENERIFNKIMKITQKMQEMRKEDI